MREEIKMPVRLPGRPQGASPTFPLYTPFKNYKVKSRFLYAAPKSRKPRTPYSACAQTSGPGGSGNPTNVK